MTETTRETAERVLLELRELNHGGPGDPELEHSRADELLCEMLTTLGYEQIVSAWHEVDKWYA